MNQRIRKIGLDNIVTTIAGTGERGFAGDGGAATSAEFEMPSGIAIAPNGEIYVVDSFNHRVRKIALDQTISTIAGSGPFGNFGDDGKFEGDGGPAHEARLNNPSEIAIAPNGELYIVDAGNHRIRKIGLDNTIYSVAGNGKSGFAGRWRAGHRRKN